MRVAKNDAWSVQEAARTLLRYGVVTPKNVDDESFAQVRRWATDLDPVFRELFGYALDIRPTAVRVMRSLDALDPTLGASTANGPFDRARYALLALTLAVVERAGAQISLSELASRVGALGVSVAGLAFDPDQARSRRAFVHVVGWLEQVGVLALADGDRDGWEGLSPDAEALYDIDRDVARLVFSPSRSLFGAGSVRALLHAPRADLAGDALSRSRRQRLARALAERPVVYFADLEPDFAGWVRAIWRTVAKDLHVLTAARVERRREGLALISPERDFTDEAFPRPGGDAQAALLLGDLLAREARRGGVERVAWPMRTHWDEVIDAVMPESVVGDAPIAAFAPDSAETAPFVGDGWLVRAAQDIVRAHGDGLNKRYQTAPEALVEDGMGVLVRFDLVRRLPGGFAVLPALARFREVTVRAAPGPLFAALEAP